MLKTQWKSANDSSQPAFSLNVHDDYNVIDESQASQIEWELFDNENDRIVDTRQLQQQEHWTADASSQQQSTNRKKKESSFAAIPLPKFSSSSLSFPAQNISVPVLGISQTNISSSMGGTLSSLPVTDSNGDGNKQTMSTNESGIPSAQADFHGFLPDDEIINEGGLPLEKHRILSSSGEHRIFDEYEEEEEEEDECKVISGEKDESDEDDKSGEDDSNVSSGEDESKVEGGEDESDVNVNVNDNVRVSDNDYENVDGDIVRYNGHYGDKVTQSQDSLDDNDHHHLQMTMSHDLRFSLMKEPCPYELESKVIKSSTEFHPENICDLDAAIERGNGNSNALIMAADHHFQSTYPSQIFSSLQAPLPQLQQQQPPPPPPPPSSMILSTPGSSGCSKLQSKLGL